MEAYKYLVFPLVLPNFSMQWFGGEKKTQKQAESLTKQKWQRQVGHKHTSE